MPTKTLKVWVTRDTIGEYEAWPKGSEPTLEESGFWEHVAYIDSAPGDLTSLLKWVGPRNQPKKWPATLTVEIDDEGR